MYLLYEWYVFCCLLEVYISLLTRHRQTENKTIYLQNKTRNKTKKIWYSNLELKWNHNMRYVNILYQNFKGFI